MKVCICGGGNLGHVLAGYIAAKPDYEVSILTRRPERWSRQLSTILPDSTTLTASLHCIADSAEALIPTADMVVLCLPGFAIADTLRSIAPHLKPGTPVGSVVSSTGFFFEAFSLLPQTTPLFGFQRVPFIARVVEYGHCARLLGFKKQLHMAVEQTTERSSVALLMEQMLDTPVGLLHNFYEASITNSNPLLHTSRLFSLWGDWHEGVVFPARSRFYADWTDEASQLLIAMDAELSELIGRLPVAEGTIPPILDYYESCDAPSLTRKLKSIKAFSDILAPMKAVAGGYVPDFDSRYFTEDFPYGLNTIHRLMQEHHISAPHIGRVNAWGMGIVGNI